MGTQKGNAIAIYTSLLRNGVLVVRGDDGNELAGFERADALRRLVRVIDREDDDIFDTVPDELGGSPCADPYPSEDAG
jgi:hypothetical protein